MSLIDEIMTILYKELKGNMFETQTQHIIPTEPAAEAILKHLHKNYKITRIKPYDIISDPATNNNTDNQETMLS